MANNNKIELVPLFVGLVLLILLWFVIKAIIPIQFHIYLYLFAGIVVIIICFVIYKCTKDAEFKRKTFDILKKVFAGISRFGSNVIDEFDEKSDKKGKKKKIPIKLSVKKEIFERADNACQHCARNRGLDIHHIDENPANNNKNNLIVLCASCHRDVGSISKIALMNESKKSRKKAKTVNIYK